MKILSNSKPKFLLAKERNLMIFLHFRYVRALGAFYMRLVGTAVECYKYLEPLYNDYRKIRYQNKEGSNVYFLISLTMINLCC